MSSTSVLLRNRTGEVVARCRIDAADASRVSSIRWHLSNHGYAVGKVGRRNMPMHRLIVGCEFGDGTIVDHINGDKLDNRKSNLRRVSPAENAQNRHAVTGTIPYAGVTKERRLRRFRAQTIVNGRPVHLGYHDTAEAAARAVVDYRATHAPFSREARDERRAAA